ncbi:DMT family transporter [Paenisporosarcina cavernae]|uniref:DMT family transporter n=1 Tax=Paenisporosarcina cavernae TaxID=2320858 RepID=A0A385YUE0_9BACL|nr:DMT family transporter [Paenisporosarcina cavernae]AYC30505.1 DMT family transporter [Paenisporosarcina cavernae]
MRGIIFSILGGLFITLQSVFNARISQDIGTWQTAMITQLTGFIAAILLLFLLKDKTARHLSKVKPLYLIGGTFGAVVVFSNIMAIHYIGVTLTIAAVLIAQLTVTFIIDKNGWFGVKAQRMGIPQTIGILLMISGVVILSM